MPRPVVTLLISVIIFALIGINKMTLVRNKYVVYHQKQVWKYKQWWHHTNESMRTNFLEGLHQRYLKEFKKSSFDVLSVATVVGNRTVQFRLYAPKHKKDVVTSSIRSLGQWEGKENKHFHVNKNCKGNKCGLFVDIGANLGYWSLFMAHLGYDVLSFEALPMNTLLYYATLIDLIDPKVRKRIKLFPIGLSNLTKGTIGKCTMCSDSVNTQNGHLMCSSKDKRSIKGGTCVSRANGTSIPVYNLDELLEKMFPELIETNDKRSLVPITLMKIDTEGHEEQILTPFLDYLDRNFVLNLICECWDFEIPFYRNEIGKRMKILNPKKLHSCISRIGVNLFFKAKKRIL